MKKSYLSLLSVVIVSALVGCQPTTSSEDVKPTRTGSAKRACANRILYRFLYPQDDYSVDPVGCSNYYVHRGQTRQFTIRMSNTSSTDNYQLNIRFPYQPSIFNYTVASVSGGTVTTIIPPGGNSSGGGMTWTYNNMTGGTSATLVLNVTGGYGAASAENGLSIDSSAPCESAVYTGDCSEDDNLHLILVD